MRVVAIGNARDRMPENLDGRLGDVFVVVGRTRLAQIFEFPGLGVARLGVRPRLNCSETTELLKGLRSLRSVPFVVAGGPHPSACAAEVLRLGADAVVIGEGERTFLVC